MFNKVGDSVLVVQMPGAAHPATVFVGKIVYYEADRRIATVRIQGPDQSRVGTFDALTGVSRIDDDMFLLNPSEIASLIERNQDAH